MAHTAETKAGWRLLSLRCRFTFHHQSRKSKYLVFFFVFKEEKRSLEEGNEKQRQTHPSTSDAEATEPQEHARSCMAGEREEIISPFQSPAGYPGVVLFNSTRVLLNSTRVPTRVCGPYRSKNNALGVFRTPGGVLGTCFAL